MTYQRNIKPPEPLSKAQLKRMSMTKLLTRSEALQIELYAFSDDIRNVHASSSTLARVAQTLEKEKARVVTMFQETRDEIRSHLVRKRHKGSR